MEETYDNGRFQVKARAVPGPRTVECAAQDTLLHAPRTLRLLRPELADDLPTRQRFLTEARVLGRVTHPSIVRLYDLLHDDSDGFVMVLEPWRGRLRDIEATWPLPPPRAAAVTRQVLAGLAFLHGAGVVHRDLRLDHLLVGLSGNVIIGDLASSRMENDRRLFDTQPGDLLGLALNVAPEARMDSSKATERGDLFTVGALLFTMLTGQAPPDLSLLHLDDRALQRIPPGFRPIVARANAYDPDQRFASAREMGEAIASLDL